MIQGLCRKILFGWMGYRTNVTLPVRDKMIIAVAPHTSNWDFVIGILYAKAVGMKVNILMKKEWFFWPMGHFMRSLGAIPVTRDRQMSLTDQLAERAREMSTFRLAITPEGTRKATSEWKRGFYVIAKKANIPIQLYALDFEQRLITATCEVTPDRDPDEAMPGIKAYYKDVRGKHPDRFRI